jgi:hypothetical protein
MAIKPSLGTPYRTAFLITFIGELLTLCDQNKPSWFPAFTADHKPPTDNRLKDQRDKDRQEQQAHPF